MIEYHCPDCDESEIRTEIIIKKKCPHCNEIMEVYEEWEAFV
ncbi:hypothetical protein LC087_19090 (plasmid) [Bacillus carboniphilus]|uniref:Uncharacterized protein n=1 Tax=Bacillus carboniphilus TaxID=86663 RepID=A0ABY9K072_9BACI|nr:hypothetical protein [Bacillus carboniphilus]WLR44414.1 hypothetical protein LC087_19090 [Bacillus carboniphilus]